MALIQRYACANATAPNQPGAVVVFAAERAQASVTGAEARFLIRDGGASSRTLRSSLPRLNRLQKNSKGNSSGAEARLIASVYVGAKAPTPVLGVFSASCEVGGFHEAGGFHDVEEAPRRRRGKSRCFSLALLSVLKPGRIGAGSGTGPRLTWAPPANRNP